MVILAVTKMVIYLACLCRLARRDRAEAAVAALARSAVFYAGDEMDEGLWGRLYKPLQAGLEKAAVSMEGISNAAVQALVAGAAEMEPQAEATPAFAAQYFLGLQRKGIRKGVQVSTGPSAQCSSCHWN